MNGFNFFLYHPVLKYFSAVGPLDVFLKLPVTEISEIDDRKSVSLIYIICLSVCPSQTIYLSKWILWKPPKDSIMAFLHMYSKYLMLRWSTKNLAYWDLPQSKVIELEYYYLISFKQMFPI